MTTQLSRSPTDSGKRRWYLGPALGIALALAEYVAISTSFDAQPLRRAGGVSGALGILGIVGPMFVVVLTSVVLLQGASIVNLLASQVAPSGRQLGARVGANLALFGAFWLLTSRVFVSGTTPGEPLSTDLAPSTLAAWGATAAAVAFSALQVTLPAGGLKASRRTWWTLLGGIAVGLVAWGAGQVSTHLWSTWGGFTMRASGALLSFVYDDVFVNLDDQVMGTERFYVSIAPVCSGFESMGLVSVLLTAYLVGFRERFRFPRSVVLVPIGIAAAWVANSLRIAALVVLGTSVSPTLALGSFHSKAGWVLFCIVGLGVAWLGQARYFRAEGAAVDAAPPSRSGNATAAFLSPMLVLLGTALVTGALFEPLDRAYVVRVVAGGLLLGVFWRRYRLTGPEPFDWVSVVSGLLLAPFWLWMAGAPDDAITDLLHEQLGQLGSVERAAWLAARLVGFVVVVPLAEELAFRGYLLRRLVNQDFQSVPLDRFAWAPALGSALVFGVLHGAWLAGIGAGVLFAWIQSRRGRTWDAVVSHAVANGAIGVFILWTGRYELWL